MYAVAGIYLLPSKSSILIGLLATGIGFLFTALFNVVYYHYNAFTGLYTPLLVPVFAFPFNIAVLLVIFSLRLRLKVSKPIMNDYGVFNPELALQTYQERFKRFSHLGIPQFAIPLNGLWTITQGNNGMYTHKLDWAYAWDFEMLNSEKRSYDKEDNNLNDYFSYGKPVLASAAGYVVKISDGILDNPIGQVNTKDNWGNYVCLSHSYGLYSFYAHLKQSSIRIKVGDYVQKGDCIAQLGNSGRSSVPHLHFQVQLGIEPGSPTRLSHLINYKLVKEDKTYEFIGSGIPKEGDTISALVAEPHLQSILALQQHSEQQLQIKRGKKQSTEFWKVNLDLLGNFTIKSTKHTELGFSVYDGIYNSLSLKGNRKSALAAFALLISRLPYLEQQEIYLTDEPAFGIISPALRL
jgi:murein DD-endopeptidase MepM/ murein hydrolase activator NlpD